MSDPIRLLPWLVLMAAVLTTPARAETVALQLDWSGIDDATLQKITGLQNSGALPVPLIFIGGRPVGMLGDPFELDLNAGQAKIDVGISSLLERPLYSVTLPAEGDPTSAKITWSHLAAHEKVVTDKLSLILESTVEEAVVPVVDRDGVATISLPPPAYLTLADAITQQTQTTKWLALDGVDVYQRDPSNGETVAPVFAKFETPGDVLRAERLGDLAQPYAKNIDVSWLGDQWRNRLLPEPAVPLLIRSVPDAAEIHISGVKQSVTTEATFPVLKSLWPEIFIRKDKYRPCQVDPQKVVPPTRTGEPSVFTCKLQKRK